MRKIIRSIYRKIIPLPPVGNTVIHSNGWDRAAIASKYITGDGIEIGALHSPLKVPSSVRVKYVDRMPVPDLRKQYPELSSCNLVNVDIIDDGERLDSILDSTQDFVIANHFIERCQNPLMSLSNMFRVLKEYGILYLAIPDKRFTFDITRPITTFAHILKDFEDGPEWSRRMHIEEWVKLVININDVDEFERKVNQIIENRYSIHYHVWTQFEILEIILNLNKVLDLHFNIELFLTNQIECIFILRKT